MEQIPKAMFRPSLNRSDIAPPLKAPMIPPKKIAETLTMIPIGKLNPPSFFTHKRLV
jgi:hypothetical protein